MSNTEQNPTETVCSSSEGTSCVQILEPREVPLGGLRSMSVRRTLPQRSRSLIGAWCFVDHYGPNDLSVTRGMNVAAHPHIGLQTVSWLFSGAIEHRDSAGFHALVKPGELNLMTAGDGISHSERSTPETSTLHGAQLWVALPEKARTTPKTFEHYAPPTRSGEGWSAQVFLGALLGEHSPVVTHSPLVGAEINLQPGAQLDLQVNPAFEHGVLLDSGSLEIGSLKIGSLEIGSLEVSPGDSADLTSLTPTELAYVPTGAAIIRLRAGETGARLLFIGGEPLGEQIVMWWNFIGRTHEDIAQARADWQAQLQSAGVADVTPATHPNRDAVPTRVTADRFGLPANEPEPPLPAPPLPVARLIPRKNRAV